MPSPDPLLVTHIFPILMVSPFMIIIGIIRGILIHVLEVERPTAKLRFVWVSPHFIPPRPIGLAPALGLVTRSLRYPYPLPRLRAHVRLPHRVQFVPVTLPRPRKRTSVGPDFLLQRPSVADLERAAIFRY